MKPVTGDGTATAPRDLLILRSARRLTEVPPLSAAEDLGRAAGKAATSEAQTTPRF